MPKITLIGAGSVEFTLNLCSDILLSPALADSTICLMDISPERLEQARRLALALVERRRLTARIVATTERREAVRDADYVITTFQQGGLSAYTSDIEIPRRFGVGQCIGDTLGPGGIFRALRSIPIFVDLCREMDDLAPDALLINYVNPMAANCWAIDALAHRPHVGLCHSVQGTSEMLAHWLDVPYQDVTYLCAGINHQAWFLEFRRGEENLYPRLREVVERPEVRAQEPVRIELFKYFGYFTTESSGHASEYYPYFRKSEQMIEQELVPLFADPCNDWFGSGRSAGYLYDSEARLARSRRGFDRLIGGEAELPSRRTHEYSSYIMEAIETNRPIRINGNVPNRGLIKSLPEGCCVEVPCLVDGNGVQPIAVGALPPHLAALNRTNINVQELIVHASQTGDIDAVYHAAMLDPLTATVCTLPQIRAMVDEMLSAQAQWLPQFGRRLACA
ncbi:MAG: alpha-glucosidase/alpha-galactosidase [Rudaea sp.]